MLNDKVDDYRKLLEEVRNLLEEEDIDIDQLKKLSKEAVAIEETTDKELLKEFNNDHPLREVNIVVEVGEGEVNFLFSCGDSSELYDLQENKERALGQAIKSNDVEFVKKLLMVLLPDTHLKKLNFEYLKEVETLLFNSLKSDLSKDMENYLEKKLKFCNFLCSNFNLLATKPVDIEEVISLFAAQSNVDYQIDKLLLSLVAEDTEIKELLSDINNMVELLKKYEKFEELEYKVRRLKSELKNGKSKYPIEVMQASIEEREKEMKEIEEKYIKRVDLVDERRKLVKQLLSRYDQTKFH